MNLRSSPTRLKFAEAGDEALAVEMRRDERIFVMATTLPRALREEFGPERVRITPISEALLTGMAVGAAADGLRPVVSWRNVTFSFNAFDQIANQAAKMRYMSGGQRALPIVFRCYGGGGLRVAAQHSQSPYSIFAHMAGLKVVVPSKADDVYGLVRAALLDDNPVISFEPSLLDDTETEMPTEDHYIPLGRAEVARSGSDVTIVAVGTMVRTALAAAAEMAKNGLSAEVIDLRSVAPLDTDTVLESVKRTGRLVLVDEAPAMCSISSEVSATLAEDADALGALLAPVRRVAGAHAPVPFSAPLEDEVVPSVERIIAAIRETMQRGRPAKDHE